MRPRYIEEFRDTVALLQQLYGPADIHTMEPRTVEPQQELFANWYRNRHIYFALRTRESDGEIHVRSGVGSIDDIRIGFDTDLESIQELLSRALLITGLLSSEV